GAAGRKDDKPALDVFAGRQFEGGCNEIASPEAPLREYFRRPRIFEREGQLARARQLAVGVKSVAPAGRELERWGRRDVRLSTRHLEHQGPLDPADAGA